MTIPRLALACTLALLCGCAADARAQDDEPRAITARVRGTFVDTAGGGGVLSGDMTVVRFEVRNGAVIAIGEIVGALADSAGNVLGAVKQELALQVGNVGSTCNQLRMDLAATDADVLQTLVHFDKEVAGFDSRDGTTPRALAVLCTMGQLLRNNPTPDALARALNEVAAAMAAAAPRAGGRPGSPR
jgi:hypothetical protein